MSVISFFTQHTYMQFAKNYMDNMLKKFFLLLIPEYAGGLNVVGD